MLEQLIGELGVHLCDADTALRGFVVDFQYLLLFLVPGMVVGSVIDIIELNVIR